MRCALAIATLFTVLGCRSEPPAPRPIPSLAPSLAPSLPLSLAGQALEGETPHRFANARLFCSDYVTRSAKSIKDTGGWAHLRPTTPSCREVKLPVPFQGDATFKRAIAVALDSGLSKEQRVVVEMPDGLEDTPIAWSYDDPHAATVVQHPATLESLQIDGATLVAVVGREHAWAPGDGGANEWVLLRGVVGCKAGPTLACRGWFPEVDAPSLGIKHRAWDAKTSWAQIAWDRAPSFTLTASGTLNVAP